MAADPPPKPGSTSKGVIRAFAPAKINLYLHLIGRRPDGYHLLDSLFAFCDIGDWVNAAPADDISLTIDGPESTALAAASDENLVLRAARLLADALPQRPSGAALHLQKNLPVSSGIGGGSADAAAALRALLRLWQQQPDPDVLADIALKLGADVPACLASQPVWVGGIGEQLDTAPGLPPAGIVLANPRRAVSTPAIFKARQGSFSEPARFVLSENPKRLAALLRDRRNDLAAPAISIVPEIADVLHQLENLGGALLARMSGSGATCFALFADRAAAATAAAQLSQARPEWWVAAGALTTAAPEIGTPPEAR